MPVDRKKRSTISYNDPVNRQIQNEFEQRLFSLSATQKSECRVDNETISKQIDLQGKNECRSCPTSRHVFLSSDLTISLTVKARLVSILIKQVLAVGK